MKGPTHNFGPLKQMAGLDPRKRKKKKAKNQPTPRSGTTGRRGGLGSTTPQ